jgi:hypothetical protein
MKKIIHTPFIPLFLSILLLIVTSLLVQACGGSKESSSSAPASTDAAKVEPTKEVASAEPTMKNMQTAMVDAIKVISTDTVSEVTALAKKQQAIPIPESFEKVQGALETAGKSDLFKGLSSSLNTSALGAMRNYKDVVGDTIDSIGLPNMDTILKGGNDSLTRYVESAAGSKLKNSLIPFVKEAAKDAGAQEWIDKIQGALPKDTGGLLGKVSAATGVKLPTNFDVEGYLTDQLMGKFFGVMANQEKLFRKDPKGRSADLFEKVMAAAQ